MLLPAAAGPALGCPAGDAVAFLAEAFARVVLSCLSSPPQGFPPLFREVAVPATLPATVVPSFFQAELPPGGYVVFVAVTPPEAFADGVIDAADVIAAASAAFAVVPKGGQRCR